MGKMNNLYVLINEEFLRVARREAFPSELEKVFDLMVNHDCTVCEAVAFLLSE